MSILNLISPYSLLLFFSRNFLYYIFFSRKLQLLWQDNFIGPKNKQPSQPSQSSSFSNVTKIVPIHNNHDFTNKNSNNNNNKSNNGNEIGQENEEKGGNNDINKNNDQMSTHNQTYNTNEEEEEEEEEGGGLNNFLTSHGFDWLVGNFEQESITLKMLLELIMVPNLSPSSSSSSSLSPLSMIGGVSSNSNSNSHSELLTHMMAINHVIINQILKDIQINNVGVRIGLLKQLCLLKIKIKKIK